MGDLVAVHPHHAGAELPRDLVTPRQVRRPQAGAQTVVHAVRYRDSLFILFERADSDERTEDFLAIHGVGRFRADNGGFYKTAFRQVIAIRHPSTGQHLAALIRSDLAVAQDFFLLLFRSQWAHLSVRVHLI